MSSDRSCKRSRTELENRIRDNIVNPPRLSDFITPMSVNTISFRCPSMSNPDNKHTILMTSRDNKLMFNCTCNNDNLNCKHLNSTINYIIRSYVNQMNKQMNHSKMTVSNVSATAEDYNDTPKITPNIIEDNDLNFDEKMDQLNKALELFGICDYSPEKMNE